MQAVTGQHAPEKFPFMPGLGPDISAATVNMRLSLVSGYYVNVYVSAAPDDLIEG